MGSVQGLAMSAGTSGSCRERSLLTQYFCSASLTGGQPGDRGHSQPQQHLRGGERASANLWTIPGCPCTPSQACTCHTQVLQLNIHKASRSHQKNQQVQGSAHPTALRKHQHKQPRCWPPRLGAAPHVGYHQLPVLIFPGCVHIASHLAFR